MSRLMETAADLAVKNKLWETTKLQVMRFAQMYADRKVIGDRYSDGQRDATQAAKNAGYPKGLVRAVGRALIVGGDTSDAVSDYRTSIGM